MEKYDCIFYIQVTAKDEGLFSLSVVGNVILCSMVVTGPVTHYLYQFLETAFPNRSTQYSVVKKVIADRLLFAPPYLLALFYCVARMEVRQRTPCTALGHMYKRSKGKIISWLEVNHCRIAKNSLEGWIIFIPQKFGAGGIWVWPAELKISKHMYMTVFLK